MRILVVGAGAVGGYFGGRLIQAGRDVTFLVRARRARELVDQGLVIDGQNGSVTLRNVCTVTAQSIGSPFDLVILSCKAYDLADAMHSLKAAVGSSTAILPLLNGLRHLDTLDHRFGQACILGGWCAISAQLVGHRVVQFTDQHSLSFGERDGSSSDRVRAILETVSVANIDARSSGKIMLEMWEKWVFLAALAGITCLMRASIGDIVAVPEGREMIVALLAECAAIAEAQGYAPRPAFLERTRGALTAADSLLTASMLRDIESGGRIEAEHVLGDLMRRRPDSGHAAALLRAAYAHAKSYEKRRERAAPQSAR